MLNIFVILGKRFSDADGVVSSLLKNSSIHSLPKDVLVEDGLYTCLCDARHAKKLYERYGKSVHIMYINTPSDKVLQRGILETRKSDANYEVLCADYLVDTKAIEELLGSIPTVIRIASDNVSDATREVLEEMKLICS